MHAHCPSQTYGQTETERRTSIMGIPRQYVVTNATRAENLNTKLIDAQTDKY